MLLVARNCNEVVQIEPVEPQYSPLLDKMVETGILEVRHVDAKGRMGPWASSPTGERLWLPVETDLPELRFMLPGPGRYAVIARDYRGRHLGRNDIFARESGQPDPWRQPTEYERLKAEFARERKRRDEIEAKLRADVQTERDARREAERAAREAAEERDRLQRELEMMTWTAERHERAVESERRRRQATEKACAAAKKNAAESRLHPKDIAKIAMTVGPLVYYVYRRVQYVDRKTRAPRPGESTVRHRGRPPEPPPPPSTRGSPPVVDPS